MGFCLPSFLSFVARCRTTRTPITNCFLGKRGEREERSCRRRRRRHQSRRRRALPNQTSVQHVPRRRRQWRRRRGRRNGKNATVTGRPRHLSLSLSLSLTLDSRCRRPRLRRPNHRREEVSHIIPLQRRKGGREEERAAVSQPQCPRKSKAATATEGRRRQWYPSPHAPSRPTGRPTEAIRALERRKRQRDDGAEREDSYVLIPRGNTEKGGGESKRGR